MTTELGVEIRGAAGELAADRVLAQMSRLLSLIGLLEDRELKKDRSKADRSTWAFTKLGLGSVRAALVPLEPRGGADWNHLDRLPLSVVNGFKHVEAAVSLPPSWDEQAAGIGAATAARAGPTSDSALVLSVVVDGVVDRRVEVTTRLASQLRIAARAQRKSLGSVIGTLASANTRRRRAGLWTDLDDRRIDVLLSENQAARIGAFLPSRVQIYGELARNSTGQLLSVRAADITSMQSMRPRLVDSFGVARGHLDELTPTEYLDAAGGWS